VSRLPGALVSAVVLLLTVVGAGQVLAPQERSGAAAAPAPVLGVTAVCPDLRQDGPLRTRVSAGVAEGPAGPGSVTARLLRDERPAAALPLTRPGQVALSAAGELDGDALVVRGTGALAPALEVEQVTRGERGSQRGFAALRCEAPRTDAWFVGGSTRVGEGSLLLLVNPDDRGAVVDVRVWTSTGPVDERPGRGIAIGPRARTAVQLDTLAPDRDLLAVHVTAVRGRFAGGLRHVRFDGRVPRGVDWVPRSEPPARTVVVAGLPAGPGRRALLVTNPGEDDTTVSIELTTGDGQLVPPGLEALEVPAGTTVAPDLSALLAGTPAAVRVRSDGGPVLASGLVTDARFVDGRAAGAVRELSYAAATAPLTGPALLTDVVLEPPVESTLLVSALDGDARVVVTPVPVLGGPTQLPAAKTVEVAAGRTAALRLSTFLPPGSTGRLALDVRPAAGSGPVHAARYLRERGATGPLTTLLSLAGASGRVPRPVVVRDPLVGAGG
jgi:hypothetical protein